LPELGAVKQKHILRNHHHHFMKLIGQSPIGDELIQVSWTFSFIQASNRGKSLRPSQYGPCDRVSHGGSHGPQKKGGLGNVTDFFLKINKYFNFFFYSEIQANRLNSGEIRLNSGDFRLNSGESCLNSGENVLKSGKKNFA